VTRVLVSRSPFSLFIAYHGSDDVGGGFSLDNLREEGGLTGQYGGGSGWTMCLGLAWTMWQGDQTIQCGGGGETRQCGGGSD